MDRDALNTVLETDIAEINANWHPFVRHEIQKQNDEALERGYRVPFTKVASAYDRYTGFMKKKRTRLQIQKAVRELTAPPRSIPGGARETSSPSGGIPDNQPPLEQDATQKQIDDMVFTPSMFDHYRHFLERQRGVGRAFNEQNGERGSGNP
jgi:hypothetical protein